MIDDDENLPVFGLARPEEEFPEPVIELLADLIKRENVQSVSFPFNNTRIWGLLVEEQVSRARRTNKPLQEALALAGPDGGLSCDPAEWGGEVHIPYEGCCMGDLFVVPKWRSLYPDWKDQFPRAGNGKGDKATLGDYAHYMADPESGHSCHYLLTVRDLGELGCAKRQDISDDWKLYESNRPYVKVNMLGD